MSETVVCALANAGCVEAFVVALFGMLALGLLMGWVVAKTEAKGKIERLERELAELEKVRKGTFKAYRTESGLLELERKKKEAGK